MYVTQKELDAVSEAIDQYGSIVAACNDDTIANEFIVTQTQLYKLHKKMSKRLANQEFRAAVNKLVRKANK